MEVGQRDKIKIGAIIQARYNSTRLPGKVLMPLPLNGQKSIIDYVVSILKNNDFIDDIFIATSRNKENDLIRSKSEELGIQSFSGSEENVLSRFIAIIEANCLDVVVRVTADNPLIDNNVLSDAIRFLIDADVDYVHTVGLPLGMNVEVCKAAALLASMKYELSKQNKEHVTQFLYQSKLFKSEILKVDLPSILSQLRCTIDYSSDYAFMNLLIPSIDINHNDILTQLLEFIEKYPWCVDINSTNYQKSSSMSLKEQLKIAIPVLEKYELDKVVDKLNECKLDN